MGVFEKREFGEGVNGVRERGSSGWSEKDVTDWSVDGCYFDISYIKGPHDSLCGLFLVVSL